MRYDMVVIGAGPAGEKAATQAAYFGRRVAVVDRREAPGGSVVGSAGIPTKTLRETALYLTGFRRREVYGVGMALMPEVALERLKSRTAEVTKAMTEVVRENLRRNGVELVQGEASIGGDRRVAVRHPDGASSLLEAEVVLVATGSRPLRPAAVPFDAAGDVIGPPALASVAAEQGRVAACHAFGVPFKQTVDPLPPYGVYSIPEAGPSTGSSTHPLQRAHQDRGVQVRGLRRPAAPGPVSATEVSSEEASRWSSV